MQCALEKRGGNALLIIGSDQPFPGEVLSTIKSSKDILSVKVAALCLKVPSLMFQLNVSRRHSTLQRHPPW